MLRTTTYELRLSSSSSSFKQTQTHVSPSAVYCHPPPATARLLSPALKKLSLSLTWPSRHIIEAHRRRIAPGPTEANANVLGRGCQKQMRVDSGFPACLMSTICSLPMPPTLLSTNLSSSPIFRTKPCTLESARKVVPRDLRLDAPRTPHTIHLEHQSNASRSTHGPPKYHPGYFQAVALTLISS